MLTLKLLREQPELVIERLSVKNFDARELVYQILDLDKQRRVAQVKADALQSEQKQAAKQIGALMAQGRREEANVLKRKTAEAKDEVRALGQQQEDFEKRQDDLLVLLPNLPNEIVARGLSDADNVLVREGGVRPMLPEGVLPHWELAKKYDIIDFDLGVKLTGAGFPVYKGKGARLQQALIQYFLEQNTRAGYLEIEPPIMVNAASGYGTGQLPDKGDQMYHADLDDFYMIPTAEVPVTNMYRDTILDIKELPVKLTAYSPCFRREAGSYGKDVRGLNRLHQFDKVEIVQLCHPDLSYEALDQMVKHVEGLVQSLELPYRIVRLCGGDLSFTSAITYDFEVWSAAQGRWLEVSSVSNFESFQANRLKARFRDDAGKIQLVHTLNGSSLALPRIVAALLENNQTPEGIKMPKVLHKYLYYTMID